MHSWLKRFETVLLAVTLSAIMTGLSIEGLTETEWELPSAPAAHNEPLCSNCHVLVAQVGEVGTSAFINSDKCLACHQITTAPGASTFNFHQGTNDRCLDCHDFHNTVHVQAGEQVIAYPFGNQTTLNHCASCHSVGQNLANLTEGHRQAAALYHTNSQALASLTPSEGCLLCHSKTAPIDATSGIALSSIPRFFEHASHPMGEPMTPKLMSGGFSLAFPSNPLLVLIDGRIECQTCHNLTSQFEKLIPIEDINGQLCTACHIRN